MAYLRGEEVPPAPGAVEVHALVRRHYDDILEYYGERRGIGLARKHLAWYCTGFDGANEFRRSVNTQDDISVVKAMIDVFFLGAGNEVAA